MKHPTRKQNKRITIHEETFETVEQYMAKYKFATYWDFITSAIHFYCKFLDDPIGFMRQYERHNEDLKND